METDNDIFFYGHSDKYKYCYMSNFYKSDFIDSDGIKYFCNEQYFMYKKCKYFDPDNKKLLELIMTDKSPFNIKKYGRQVKNFDETKWEKIRYQIMVDGIRLKFTQSDILKDKLIMTGDKNLYEASKTDKIWGIGYDASDAININKTNFGLNLLGKALMQVRNEIK